VCARTERRRCLEETRAEKSLVVVGKSLELALDKAAIVLHCPRERIAYEIMQQVKPGKYGQPGTPCKLRVTPVAPAAETLDGQDGLSDEELLMRVVLPPLWDTIAAEPSAAFLHCLEDELGRVRLGEKLSGDNAAPPPNLREIIGDVGLATGAIHHAGDLHIHGNVRKGMTVRASGYVHILGDVETAFVDAGGNVTIDGGLLGTVRSAWGRITCRFAQGAQIDAARGNARVQESSMHSTLHAGGEITIGGILLGGTCYGEQGVEAHTAGSLAGVATTIMAGRNARLYEEMEQTRQCALRHIERLGECERARLELLPGEEAGTPRSVQNRARLWQMSVRRVRLTEDLRRLTGQKSRLLGMINEEHGSRICVGGSVYPQVKIIVDDAALEVRAVTQFATFSKDYEAGELRITPLH